jgi:hypothetical protein
MRPYPGSITPKGRSTRCVRWWWGCGRGVAASGARASAHGRGEARSSDGGSVRPPGRGESEREEQRRE